MVSMVTFDATVWLSVINANDLNIPVRVAITHLEIIYCDHLTSI